MKKILLVGGEVDGPSNYLTLDTDREAVTPALKLILDQDIHNKTSMERLLIEAMKALLSLDIEVINAVNGGQKKQEGVIGRLVDLAWAEIESTSAYRASYTHPTLSSEARLNIIETERPHLVFFLGGEKEFELYHLAQCKEMCIPMISPKGWSDIEDKVFDEVMWNKKHYFGKKSLGRKTSKIASALSLFNYLYKDGVYAPYLQPDIIKLVVSNILALPNVKVHNETVV